MLTTNETQARHVVNTLSGQTCNDPLVVYNGQNQVQVM